MQEKFHILVVDDSLLNIFFIEKILVKNGFEVSSVQSGLEALEFLEEHHPDLILLDIMMPDINGYDTCKRIKASKRGDIPVIFVTAKTQEQDIKYGYSVGGEDYIRKPILQEELLARINIVLEKVQAVKRFQEINIALEEMVSNRTKELNLLFKIVKLVPQQDTISGFCQKLVDTIQDNFGFGNFGVRLHYENDGFQSHNFEEDHVIISREFKLDGGSDIRLCVSFRDCTENDEEEIENFTDLLIIEIKQILNYKEIIRNENENREFIKSILNGTPDGIVVVNKNYQIINYNPALVEMFCLNEDEIIGKPITVIFNPDKISNNKSNIFAEIDKKGTAYFELENLSVGDTLLNCSITGAPLFNDNNKSGYLFICKNINKRIEMEAKLMSSSKMEAIGQLAAGIAHEINSPTQFIRNNIEFINESIDSLIEFSKKLNASLSDNDIDLNNLRNELMEEIEDLDLDFINEETQSAVNESLDGIDRITKIVNAMRTFSHPGNEEKSEVDINDIINKAIVVSRNEWKYDAKIDVDFQLDRLVPVFRDKLSQVILNLIINASHAIHDKKMEELGLIKITTLELKNDVAEIRIEDNGVGIPEEIRKKVYEPFFTTKEVGKGTGQGLAVIYNIVVKNHNGTVDFESEVGVGTTFIVRLPIERLIDEDEE